MFDTQVTQVNTGGNKFNFNVDAVSGLLHKSTRKSKFCVRKITDDNMVFNDERPALKESSSFGKKEPEIVVLQTMLAGNDKMIIEYMDRIDYDEMFDGPLPQVSVKEIYDKVRMEVMDKLSEDERWGRQMRRYRMDKGEELEDTDYMYDHDRSEMAEDLIKTITKKVCSHLEEKHIGTFDFGGIDYL